MENNEVKESSDVPKPIESILQYQSPHRVVTHDKRRFTHLSSGKILTAADKILTMDCYGKVSEKKQPCNNANERILNLIIEPRTVNIGKNLFIQDISSCPGKTLDVIHLQEKLNCQIKVKGAQSTGICSIRRRLFSELFDEIIRQVTVECMERGLLLSMVNNELKLSLSKIRQIYESGTAYGMNKSLRGQQQRDNYEKYISTLNGAIETLKARLSSLNSEVDGVQERERQRFLAMKKKFEIDKNFMRKNYDQLKQQLVDAIESIKHPNTA